MDIQSIQTGDTFLYQGTAFISRAIIHFMEEYRDNFPVDPAIVKLLNGFVPSHCATLVWINGVLYLYGSILFGFKPIVFTDYYSDSDSFLVMRDGLTDQQKNEVVIDVQKMTGDSAVYPVWALPMWILYVKTHWKGFLSPGGHCAEVCYKSTYEVKRAVLPDLYNQNPLYITCFDCIKPNNQIIIDNRK